MPSEKLSMKPTPSQFTLSVPGIIGANFTVKGLTLYHKYTTNNPDYTSDYCVYATVENSKEKNTTVLYPGGGRLQSELVDDQMPLLPGRNTVTFTAKSERGKLLFKKSFTVRGEGEIYERHGIVFRIDKLSSDLRQAPFFSNGALDGLARLLDEMNRFLPTKSKIRHVHILDELTTIACVNDQAMIDMSLGWFSSKGLADVVVWHEGAHFLFSYLSGRVLDPNMRELGEAFLFEARKTYLALLDMERRKPDSELFYDASLSNLEYILAIVKSKVSKHHESVVFRIFDESTYYPNDAEGGHPYHGCGELFASASTVMRFKPKEFLWEVSKLKESEKKPVLDAARFVVRQYIEHPNYPKGLFDTQLLAALGLKEPEKKKVAFLR
jgi:hypothetical protein